ncbi:hypothetical protein F5Y15DRAFT_428725 [Xylariaceae sp. FL0016]|nr:hypothetical protein F5Y15DRAFT_428725 [Xylariaceae sp. FL0016]
MDQQDIAIIGLSFKFPQDAKDASSFWDVLYGGRNLMTDWPRGRVQLDAFHDPGSRQHNKLVSSGSYFIDGEPAAFDAPFFSITAKEAASMDPQQRAVLETSYRAFENAGIPMEGLRGSSTAVYAACMSDDYLRMYSMDPEAIPPQGIMGTSPSIVASRVSWYFDLLGPSVSVDTACSGSMIAVDLAVQSLRKGDATMALVCAPNLILGPEGSMFLSNLNFLSSDGVCHSFDSRANGYARGEGVAAILLKPVADALRDKDMIRAVIRESASNQDGRTATMTQPSVQSQEALIRQVYRRAKIEYDRTRYFEAHGTGTPVGDPIEMKAIGRVFKSIRSKEEPLYVGSVKSNIGHLEGCSGLAGIIKSILILEKGIIPPNAGFQKMNPDIDSEFYHVTVPISNVPWPVDGLRRISVNSFGFGGTNSHIVMDDAYHYLQERNLVGSHSTSPKPIRCHASENGIMEDTVLNGTKPSPGVSPTVTEQARGDRLPNGNTGSDDTLDTSYTNDGISVERLLVFSAQDEKALERTSHVYQEFIKNYHSDSEDIIDRLAYTLAVRRTKFRWRNFSIQSTRSGGHDSTMMASKPIRASTETGLAFVFTGQGAQYANMGTQLLRYPKYQHTVLRAQEVLRGLGCEWDIFDELSNPSRINSPEYSQPLSTVLQIGIIDLLKSFKVTPHAVVGHSSGEIAAAYAVGALSFESALKVSYFRGKLAARLLAVDAPGGAMMSVNLSEDEIPRYTRKRIPGISEAISIACINSPLNCTVAGHQDALEELKTHLDHDCIFAVMLKTGVAYHTPQMNSIADHYLSAIGDLTPGTLKKFNSIPMFSSVTGDVVKPSTLLTAQYWVDNMVSPVRFSMALSNMVEKAAKLRVGIKTISDLLEIGPHSALKRPVLDSLGQVASPRNEIRYHSALNRTKPSLESMIGVMGTLFCHGHPISVTEINQQTDEKNLPLILHDGPEYPFDHSNTYWAESRISRDFRLRKKVSGDLLGTPAYDWNPLEPRWRKFLSTSSMPWLRDHVVTDTIVLPGMAMLVMAVEAAKQMCPATRHLAGFGIKEAQFLAPIVIKDGSDEQTEVLTHLHPIQLPYEKESTWSEVKIFTYSHESWTECFRVRIQAKYEEPKDHVDNGKERSSKIKRLNDEYCHATKTCIVPVDSSHFYEKHRDNGVDCGEDFRLLDNIGFDGLELSVATVKVTNPRHQTNDLVHPAVLDAAIQIAVVQNTHGATMNSSTFIPHQITNAWISHEGWQPPSTSSIRLMATARYRQGGRTGEAVIHALADDGKPLLSIEGLILSPVSGSAAQADADKKLLFGIEWRPQLSMLAPQQLSQILSKSSRRTNSSDIASYRNRLETVIDLIIRDTLDQITVSDVELIPKTLENWCTWMKDHVKGTPASADQKRGANLELDCQVLESSRPSWKLFPTIARNLKAVLSGRLDAKALLVDAGLLEAFFIDISNSCGDLNLAELATLMAHENPQLRILEIGNDAEAMTCHVLSTLQHLERNSGSLKFSEYHLSGCTPAFLQTTKAKFSAAGERLSATTVEEASALGSKYDLVIAANAPGSSADINLALRQVNHVLKPGGKLVLLEIISSSMIMNFGLGFQPSWWASQEMNRQWGPMIASKQRDLVLRQNGFSGEDFVDRDYDEECIRTCGMTITTAIAPAQDIGPVRNWIAVLDRESERQATLVKLIQDRVSTPMAAMFWDDLPTASVSASDVAICLVETDAPILTELSESRFRILKDLFARCENIIWVTCPKVNQVSYPYYDVVTGLIRAIRSESVEKHIVTLAVEQNEEYDAITLADSVIKATQSSFDGTSQEVEFVVREGVFMSSRLFEEIQPNHTVRSLVSSRHSHEAWMTDPPVKLSMETPGVLDTLQFIEDEGYEIPIGPNEVEIKTKAWGLNFRDVFVALGRLEGDSLGYDCSGIVTRVGDACEGGIKPGDRVCMASIGAMRTYARSREEVCVKIPDDLSFEAAASLITPGMTAYYSLIEVGRLRKGEKVLIHSGSGSTGQMACWIAKMVGAEIFTTVGFADKKQVLMDRFGIPDNHIFYSRNTTFAEGVMRMTGGYGVDVVLNHLSGDGLRASWDCIAPYGRFVEIGKSDIVANAGLPMGRFANNISFAAVDLHHMGMTNTGLLGSLLHKTIELVNRGAIQHPMPLNTYPVSEVEAAFRYLQRGTHIGRIVIVPNDSDIVPKRVLKRSTLRFRPDASYVVAGGLGGIGRGIVRWMARRGAKHLILPSRSGPNTQARQDVLEELIAEGVSVAAPKCDVSSKADLSSALEECSRTMPPIKGCINAAMHLEDSIFENMTHEQWRTTIQSKAVTSWNLHELLPDSLDFFILLSSLSGVYGSAGQSNYAAGCTFQDALARHRTSLGQKGLSLDVGWMRNIGIIAESEALQKRRKYAADMGQIEDTELMAVLDIYCDPSSTAASENLTSQVLIGVVTPADVLAAGQEPPKTMMTPLFSGFSHHSGPVLGNGNKEASLASLFRQATDPSQRAEIVVRGLTLKLSRSLSISPDEIEISKPLSEYGVDSLMAVELRNWMRQDFQAAVAVFDIMGGTPIGRIGELVVEKSEAGNKDGKSL